MLTLALLLTAPGAHANPSIDETKSGLCLDLKVDGQIRRCNHDLRLVDDGQGEITLVTGYDEGRAGAKTVVAFVTAQALTYAVVGRIALTRHEQARFVDTIEIAADLDGGQLDQATPCVAATRKQFAQVMDEARCASRTGCRCAPARTALRQAFWRRQFSAHGLAYWHGSRLRSICSGFGAALRYPIIQPMPAR